MSPGEQAAAVALLKRWRDLILAGGQRDVEIELQAMTVLFLETEAFLGYDARPIEYTAPGRAS